MAQREQLKHRDDDDPKHPDVVEDERLCYVRFDIEESIAKSPTHSPAGIAVKLWHLQRDDEAFDGEADWRADTYRTALEALARAPSPHVPMTNDPVHGALDGLADSLEMVDSARHALGTILEGMHEHPGENIGYCILRTLDAAAEQGRAGFNIVWKATKKGATEATLG